MPICRYNKKYLLEKLGFNVDDKTLFRSIESMGLGIERSTDKDLDIEFWNRPDLVSTVGFARAIRYFMRRGRKFEYELGTEDKDFVINVGRHVEGIRPYIAGLVVRNMKLSEQDMLEIINFTEKFSETYGIKRTRIALGLHDLKSVKPPFYYDAYEDERFVPLGKTIKEHYSEVLSKEEKGKLYGALGEKEKRYVALKDTVGAMSLIPILNSERTRVTAKTKDMLIDITGTSKYIIEKTADLLAANFIDMGYKVNRIAVQYEGKRDVTPKMSSVHIKVLLEQINSEIGVKFGFNDAILLGNKMGYKAALVEKSIHFTVAPYRLDVINDQDIIEDLTVAYGYDYIQPAAVPSTTPGSMEEYVKNIEKVSDTMVGLGFAEAMNSCLTNEVANFTKMRLQKGDAYISIANSRTGTITMFRTWALPSLLNNLGQSMHDRFPIKLFDLDLAFELQNSSPKEHYHLGAVNCDVKVNFNDMKAAFVGLAKKLRFKCEIARAEHKSFIDGRFMEIVVDKRRVGFIGEVHPEVLSNFEIEEPVVALELDLSEAGLC